MDALLGSTAMEIMAQVSCDVLVARRTPQGMPVGGGG